MQSSPGRWRAAHLVRSAISGLELPYSPRVAKSMTRSAAVAEPLADVCDLCLHGGNLRSASDGTAADLQGDLACRPAVRHGLSGRGARSCAAPAARRRAPTPPAPARVAARCARLALDGRLDLAALDPQRRRAGTARCAPAARSCRRATLVVPSRCSSLPLATTKPEVLTARRWRSTTGGGTIRLMTPCSSSSSMKTIPLAVAGRWRATTIPATLTGVPSRARPIASLVRTAGSSSGPQHLHRVRRRS